MLSRRLAPPLLVPAAAGLALAFAGGSSAADGAYPVIEKVSAKKVAVGQTLVLTGTGFRKGRNVNIVAFARRGGGRVVFTRARRASATRLSVVVPADLVPVFARKDGVPQPTRFGLRVLAERLGAHFTADDRSPLIAPSLRADRATARDCDGDAIPNRAETDRDDDLLGDATERAIGTNPCRADTDGDGMTDGWEQQSALDADGAARPTLQTRPYPNALDPTDGRRDSDGDGVRNATEYAAWATHGRHRLPLLFSGGSPTSAGTDRVSEREAPLDRDGNGVLSDNERLLSARGL